MNNPSNLFRISNLVVCRYNPLGDKGSRAVVDVVKYDLPLQELKLGWCKIGPKAGAEALGELLQFNETIEVRTALSGEISVFFFISFR